MSTLELPFSRGSESLRLGDGITLLRGFADTARLLPCIRHIAELAPFRHLVTPGGQTMSVAMTNCGPVGWVSDRTGYRYSSRDPLTNEDWPPMPHEFMRLALAAAGNCGFPEFVPDACLINRYSPGCSPHRASRCRRAEFRAAHRLRVAGITREFCVLRTCAWRQGKDRRIGRWRRARLGRSVATGVSRRAADQTRSASADRELSLQPHLQARALRDRYLRACSILKSLSPL